MQQALLDRVVVVADEHLVVLAGGVHRRGAGEHGLRWRRAPAQVRRRGWGRHVVEEAVVLVEVQDQHGLGPDVRVRGQRLKHPGDVVGTLRRARRARVLGAVGGGDDPRHARQLVREHVGAQKIEVTRAHAALAQCLGVTGLLEPRGAEGLEPGERVVGEVVGHVLVDLPADAGRFEPFGIGGPRVAAVVAWVGIEPVVIVVGCRAVAFGERVIGAGPDEQAVRVGAGLYRAVVGVADRERVDQRPLERHVVLGVVAQRMVLLDARPGAHAALVPGELRVGPGMGRAFDAHHRELLQGVQAKRCNRRRRAGGALVRLVPHALADDAGRVGHRDRKTVGKAAHAVERAEVVVERAVLLRQDDDVFDVREGAGAARGRDRQGSRDHGREGGQRGGGAGSGAHGTEESSAVRIGHDVLLMARTAMAMAMARPAYSPCTSPRTERARTRHSTLSAPNDRGVTAEGRRARFFHDNRNPCWPNAPSSP